jgi:adenine-specific DNA-methyltransferase
LLFRKVRGNKGLANNRNYKGSLRLDWINKNLSLYYEIDEKEGKGIRPVWVPKNDIRVAEPRILKFVKSYGDPTSENMLIKGDNLLVLRSLVEMFKGKAEKDKVKCIYIDPPFNTGNAFEKYDDNLKHSEWLTMMRDRLYLLKKLLRKDGIIFVHIDDEEMAYLKILVDEVFGRDNFLNCITIKAKVSSGASGGGEDKKIKKNTEYLLLYSKENKFYKYKPIRRETLIEDYIEEHRKNNVGFYYTRVLVNEGSKKFIKEFNGVKIYEHSNYKFDSINNIIKKEKITLKEAYMKYFDKIFMVTNAQTSILQKTNDIIRQKRKLVSYSYTPRSGKNKGMETVKYIWNETLIVWFSDSAKKKSNEVIKLEEIGTLWDDISWGRLDLEGGVSFKSGKKPEKLIKRVIEMSSGKNDVIFDSFAGAGTTGAVANKMDRRWIMVEIGKQADELIIPRLQGVLSGKDQTGISKNMNWKGGGGFRYYQLGESLIYEEDMNWMLKAEEMAEAIFLHFQYKPMKADWIEKENMYLGKHQFARYHFALSYAIKETKVLTEDLYDKIVAGLDEEKFKHLTIFTNVAVAVPPESLDERVLVKKIPAAILREYNLI